MTKQRKFAFFIGAIILVCAIIVAYIIGAFSMNIKNAEYIAFTEILKEVPGDYQKNVHLLRTLFDENQNRLWIEFYDTQSYLSSLWVGSVAIDATNFDVIYTKTHIQLYSGISPEMAVQFRKAKTELHNEYGDFYFRLI